MAPGELHEHDHPGVWLWSDLHLGHAMTISVFGRLERRSMSFNRTSRGVDTAGTALVRDQAGTCRWWTFAGPPGERDPRRAGWDPASADLHEDNLSMGLRDDVRIEDLRRRLDGPPGNMKTDAFPITANASDSLKFSSCLPERLTRFGPFANAFSMREAFGHVCLSRFRASRWHNGISPALASESVAMQQKCLRGRCWLPRRHERAVQCDRATGPESAPPRGITTPRWSGVQHRGQWRLSIRYGLGTGRDLRHLEVKPISKYANLRKEIQQLVSE